MNDIASSESTTAVIQNIWNRRVDENFVQHPHTS